MNRALRCLMVGIIVVSTLVCTGTLALWWSGVRLDHVAISGSRLCAAESKDSELSFVWVCGAPPAVAALGQQVFDFGTANQTVLGRLQTHLSKISPAAGGQRRLGVGFDRGSASVLIDEATGMLIRWERRWGEYLPQRNGAIGLSRVEIVALTVPHSNLATLTAIPAVLWLFKKVPQRWRTARRRRAGQCIACGYDLRATPARCPECGRPA